MLILRITPGESVRFVSQLSGETIGVAHLAIGETPTRLAFDFPKEIRIERFREADNGKN